MTASAADHQPEPEEHEMTEVYGAERIDQIRAAHTRHELTREDAIEQIRAAMNVTPRGAADLLDDPRSATERYSDVGTR